MLSRALGLANEECDKNKMNQVNRASLTLTVLNQSGRAMPRTFLRSWVRRMGRLAAPRLGAKRYRGRELVIVFLDEAAARELNKTYRRKDYATDVLSFESDDPAILGELVICPAVIARQAREHGLLVREELGYMVLHGFLHLLGYDHELSRKEAKKMFAIQDELFELLLVRPRKNRRKNRKALSESLSHFAQTVKR